METESEIREILDRTPLETDDIPFNPPMEAENADLLTRIEAIASLKRTNGDAGELERLAQSVKIEVLHLVRLLCEAGLLNVRVTYDQALIARREKSRFVGFELIGASLHFNDGIHFDLGVCTQVRG